MYVIVYLMLKAMLSHICKRNLIGIYNKFFIGNFRTFYSTFHTTTTQMFDKDLQALNLSQ